MTIHLVPLCNRSVSLTTFRCCSHPSNWTNIYIIEKYQAIQLFVKNSMKFSKRKYLSFISL